MEKKGRENFSQSVLKILYRRAGAKCCKCGAATFGPVKNVPDKSVNIGKGAHIAAAAPGGPRYDSKMTTEERTSASNGMWLCSNCHDTIDRDPDTYPTNKLLKMKKEAEDRIRKELGVATFTSTVRETSQSRELVTSISAMAILEIRRAKAEFLEVWRREEGSEATAEHAEHVLAKLAFLDFEQDEYVMEVAEEMTNLLREVAVHCKAPTTTLEIIRALKSIADAFNEQWEMEQVREICQLVLTAINGNQHSRRRSKVYQSGLAFLKDLSSYKSLKERQLSKAPQKALKSLRAGRDEIDTGEPTLSAARGDETDAGEPPPSKRPHMEREEEVDERYHELMEQLAECTDPDKALNLEREIESLGCEAHIQ